MDTTFKLMHDISTTETHTAEIEKDVETLDSGLKRLNNDLEISAKVNNSLRTLDSALTTASSLLTVVSVIPEIGTEASVLKRTIDGLKVPVHSAHVASDELESVLKPVRNAIQTVEPKIEQIDHALLALMNAENKFVDVLGSATHCIISMPESELKTELDQKIDSAASVVDPLVLNFDQVQITLIDGINGALGKMQQVENWFAQMIDLDNAINSVMNTLSPLINSLQAIANVFNNTIRVPYGGYPKFCKKWGVPYPCGWQTVYFSFTIKQILDGVSGVLQPIVDLLNSAMYAILNPLLNALNLHITLPSIPGLDILETMAQKLPNLIHEVSAPITALVNDLAPIQSFLSELEEYAEKLSQLNQACQLKMNA